MFNLPLNENYLDNDVLDLLYIHGRTIINELKNTRVRGRRFSKVFYPVKKLYIDNNNDSPVSYFCYGVSCLSDCVERVAFDND